jgi:Sel1 repeat
MVAGPNEVEKANQLKWLWRGGSLCALVVVCLTATGGAAAWADLGPATMIASSPSADGQATGTPGTRSEREKRRRPTEAEFEEFTAAAEGGDAKAQYKLGMIYHNGGGKDHPRDYEQAMKWLRLSADQGNVEAEDRVGLMYYLGEGVPQDYLEAVRWYKMAAEKGNAHSQWQLVDMYQKGIGVPQDLAESKRWAQLGRRPNRSALFAWLLFAGAVMAAVAFAMGLIALQYNKLSGWRYYCVAIFVHVGGAFLVINSLITYGFWVVVPGCKFGFLAPSCTQFGDAHTRSIVNWFASYAVVNLIFRFMMGVGLAMDALAGWYAVYLVRALWKRQRSQSGKAIAQAIS